MQYKCEYNVADAPLSSFTQIVDAERLDTVVVRSLQALIISSRAHVYDGTFYLKIILGLVEITITPLL